MLSSHIIIMTLNHREIVLIILYHIMSYRIIQYQQCCRPLCDLGDVHFGMFTVSEWMVVIKINLQAHDLLFWSCGRKCFFGE